MTDPVRVAYGLARATSAFLSQLVRRPPEAVSAKARDAPRTAISSGLGASAGIDNRCPVCQARFRGSRLCSRCGADLEPLMCLTVRAWQLRQAARQAFNTGDLGRAQRLAIEAEGTQNTERGEALWLLSAWLRL